LGAVFRERSRFFSCTRRSSSSSSSRSLSLTEQSVDDILFDSAVEILARNEGGVQKSAAVFAAREQVLFEQPVERGHEGGIGDSFVERAIDIADGHFAEPPSLFKHLALKFSERETCYFARATKPTQQKSRSLHVARILRHPNPACQSVEGERGCPNLLCVPL
jgi:hypothetical protein